MSSRVRVRGRGGGYLNSRGVDMSDYYKMPSNYSSKSREEKHPEERHRDRSLDKRKGEDNRKSDHHRDSSKSNGRHKEFKESFSSRENRESFIPSKDIREPFSSRGDRDSYSSRDTDAFTPRDRESYSSRGEHDSFSTRGRESYSNRGSRGSYSSRGGFEQFSSRGNRELYSNRGSRMHFSSRGGNEGYSSRGGREPFASRGRESFSSRGNRDQFLLRGGRESFSSRGRGKDSYLSRGEREPFSARGGREYFSARGFNRGMFRGSLRGSRSGSSFLGHRTQLEMTKKLVASVLKTDDSMGELMSFRPREEKGHFSGRMLKDGRRYFDEDVERRSFKESRAQRSWNQDERPLKRENLSAKFKDEHLYSSKMDKFGGTMRKRLAEIDEPEPSSKRLRLSDVGRFRGVMQKRFYESSHDKCEMSPESGDEGRSRKVSRDKHREILEVPSEKIRVSKKRTTSTSKHSKERSRSASTSRQDLKDKRKRKNSEKDKGKDDKDAKDAPKQELEEEPIRKKIEDEPKKESSRKYSSDEEERHHEKKKERKERSPGGMQVTIRSDGERAVNNDGNVKSRLGSGKVFVDLRCPHCPGHTSVTFQEYRFHLETGRHNYFLKNNVANKHSLVLRRIRLQQRNEQREIEEKIEKDDPEEFASYVSRYCRTCKLAFKVNADDIQEGYAEHNATKLHKMQKSYLFPRCVMCRMSFPCRLVYEYHIASIRHLRMKTLALENTGSETHGQIEDDEDDFATEEDLANFVTMDSVGEDEELGSEHDEITGNREDIEAAEQEAKADDEEEEEDEMCEYDDEENLEDEECGTPRRRAILEENPLEMDLTTESEHLEDLKNVEILGRDYICAIEASYCKLCNKVIRTDSSLGIEAVDLHCRTALHLGNYHYLQSEEFMDEHGEGFEEANRLEEDYLVGEEEDEEIDVDRKEREIVGDLNDLDGKEINKDSIDISNKAGIVNTLEIEKINTEVIKEEKFIKELNKEEVMVSKLGIREEEANNIDRESSVESKEMDTENLLEEIGEQLDETEVRATREKSKHEKSLKEEPKTKDSVSTKKPPKLNRRKTIPTKFNNSKT